tara:strand:- start:955 stop:1944 length:990 start_codon:yes stop_codon:yes gene_type:complete
MQLNYFNSYFEILVGLNLGFAAFDYFRNRLQSSAFKKTQHTVKLDNLLSRLKVQMKELDEQDNLYCTLSKMQEEIQLSNTSLNKQEKADRCFFDLLRPISFILSLLCITFLILAGFQELSNNIFFYNDYFFRLSCLVASFAFTSLFFSLSERILNFKIEANLFEVFLVFIFFVLLSCNNVFLTLFSSISIQIIALALIPILIHVAIVGKRILRLNKYSMKNNDNNIKDLLKRFIKLCKYNLFPGFVYFGVFLIALIPVYLFYLLKNEFIYYIIILTTPVLLYVFLFFRVWYHKIVHGKEFAKEHLKYSSNLDYVLRNIQTATMEQNSTS